MGLAAVGHQKLVGPIAAGHIFWASAAIDRYVQRGENTLRQLVNRQQGRLHTGGSHGVSQSKGLLKVIEWGRPERP